MESSTTSDLLQAPTFWALLSARAEQTPDAPMLIDAQGATLSFAGYARAASGLAAWLYERGVRPGMRITWQLPTSLSAAVLIAALSRLGVVQNPIIHLFREREVRQVLEQNRSTFYIVPTDAGLRAMVENAIRDLPQPPILLELGDTLPSGDPDGLPPPPTSGTLPAWVFYTSGTTAAPKGALHADAALMGAGRGLAESYEFGPRDVGSVAYPIAHIGGPMYLSMLLVSGGSALLIDKFSASEAAKLFKRHNVTASGGSTAHYLAFFSEQARYGGERLYPTLRVLGGGGAPKPPEFFLRGRQELGVTICHSYGMTECPGLTIAPLRSSDEQLTYTDGIPREDVEVRIVLADGTEAPRGIEGEVRVRGPGIFLGYADASQDEGAFDEHGYYRTGDLGVLREDGYLAVTGRMKDIIIRKGENVSAKEIEDLLCAHPKVLDAAVIGLPDAERGERICAVIELRHGAEPLRFDEMVEYFRQAQVMRQKIPEQLEILERLPRNDALNKVLKNKLKEHFS
jgi:acyl-CoA synthetase (AMP-forming)/AMP-acid ligase II